MQHYTDPYSEPWPWPNFQPWELASKGNGAVQIEMRAGDRLQKLRYRWDAALTVNSAYRDMAYNLSKKVKSTRDSQHPKGTAFDIRTRGWSLDELYRFKELAYKIGFRGFGGYNTKKGKPKFIHIDDRGTPAKWGNRWAWPDAYTMKAQT